MSNAMGYSVADMVTGAAVLSEVSESWRLDAQLLLAAAMQCSRESLLARPGQPLTDSQREKYEGTLQRRLQGEPIAYILGRKGFWDFELAVDQRVLIPRPETELLVELALARLSGRENEKLTLADLGTGSGAIAIALARHSDQWQVTAIDKSSEALAVARHNAASLNLANIDFLQSSWCENLQHARFDMIVSNPPYIAPSDPHLKKDGLAFEPDLALIAEAQGLADLSSIVMQTPGYLKNNAWLILEHGFQQGEQVGEMLMENGFADISLWQDLSGLDRVTASRNVSKA
ncbi:MAG: peptide chain release factor N(5)-glutamine methyltransferase [Gammaproteobacteria bacterium]|nr:peptide chain release factor N(5)-glutamine methyltransferase [Gammaproteobacteria bacterium]